MKIKFTFEILTSNVVAQKGKKQEPKMNNEKAIFLLSFWHNKMEERSNCTI